MYHTKPDGQKLLKKAKRGSAAAASDLFGGLRLDLYDYLLRMTGDVERSVQTIDEVLLSVKDSSLPSQSYDELRLLIYQTARRFNGDAWNADTTRLTNGALDHQMGEPAAIRQIEDCFRTLPGPEREALYLRTKADFEAEQVASVMGIAAAQVELRFAKGCERLVDQGNFGDQQIEALVSRLPNHPIPEASINATVDLSLVMRGIRTKPAIRWRRLTLYLTAALGLGAGLAYYWWNTGQPGVDEFWRLWHQVVR